MKQPTPTICNMMKSPIPPPMVATMTVGAPKTKIRSPPRTKDWLAAYRKNTRSRRSVR
jgi:hypothetical protein